MLAKLLPIRAAQRRNSLSPGRQPGVFSCLETKRRRREPVTESFAPMGLDLRATRVPGLTPGARLWRRFAALCVFAIWEQDVNSRPIGLSVSEMSKLQSVRRQRGFSF